MGIGGEECTTEMMEALKKIEDFVRNYGRGHLVPMAMESPGPPIVNVYPRKTDPFLGDIACVRLKICLFKDLSLTAQILTWNLELVRETSLNASEVESSTEFHSVLNALVTTAYNTCVGLNPKAVIPNKDTLSVDALLIGMCGGELIYRSKNCSFVFESKGNVPNIESCSWCADLEARLKLAKEKKSSQVDTHCDVKSLNDAEDSQLAAKENLVDFIKNSTIDFADEFHKSLSRVDGSNIIDESVSVQPLRKSLRKGTQKLDNLKSSSKKSKGQSLKDKTLLCLECSRDFSTRKEFKEHYSEHPDVYICQEDEKCLKRFKSLKELDVHVRKHKGEKPYICSDCHKDYSTRQELRLHMRKHTGEKPYQCDVCLKSFARSQQRKIHMAVHTGERAFLCPECGSSFGSMSTLIDHRKRRHMELRNHGCINCPKAFFTKQELEAHCRTHTGERPFHCSICGKSFSRTHHLKRHIRSVHKSSNAQLKQSGSSSGNKSLLGEDVMVIVETNTESDDVVESPEFVVPNQTLSRATAQASLIQMTAESGQTILLQDSGHMSEDDSEEARYVVIEEENGAAKLIKYS